MKDKVFTARFPLFLATPELIEQARTAAKRVDRTLSWWVRQAIQEKLEREERGDR